MRGLYSTLLMTALTLGCNEQARKDEYTPFQLPRDPLTAFRDPHPGVLGDSGLERVMEQARTQFHQNEEIEGRRYLKDDIGLMLSNNLKKQLSADDYNTDTLLMVLIGSMHTQTFESALRDRFNTFFYNESSHLSDAAEIRGNAYAFVFWCVALDVTSPQPVDPAKPDAIIFGDHHGGDFAFESEFPSADSLKQRGIKRIVFGAEHYDVGNQFELDDLREHHYPSYQRFANYLSMAEQQGIELRLVGMRGPYYRGRRGILLRDVLSD